METIANSYPKSLAIWFPLYLDYTPQRLHRAGRDEQTFIFHNVSNSMLQLVDM